MKTQDIHAEIEEWMAGALCGGLSAEEQELFDRHLAECEPCWSLYREEQIMNTMLEKEIAGLRPEPEFGDAMVNRFRERVGKRRGGWEWVRVIGRLAWGRPMQAVYAVLLLAGMVKTGSMITGERGRPNWVLTPIPWQAHNYTDRRNEQSLVGFFPHFEAARILQSEVASPVWGADQTTRADLAKLQGLEAKDPVPAAPGTEDQTKVADDQLTADNASGPTVPPAGMFAGSSMKSLGRDEIEVTQDGGSGAGFGGGVAKKAYEPAAPAAPAANEITAPTPDDQRKLIRNATVQYEVGDYSKAADMVTGLIEDSQGYLSTQNSDRGANGKLEGTIEAKVPPEHLDAFLLKLRVLGDLKGQTLTTEDVTKDYFDTDARVHTAQLEEQRLQEILNKDTGRLSDVLQVERELARVRQNIEEMQGTLKYYNTMVQYATVTIGLSEKDMNAPAQFLLKERADLSIYASDVEGTFARAKEMAASVKAEVVESNVERDGNGQTTATLSLLIDPDAADGAIAQLKGLGRIQNFTSTTQRVAQDGSGTSDTARTERDKVEAHLTVLQDQETAVQQTDVNVEAQDVEGRLEELKTKAMGLGAEVKGATFQRDASGSESGTAQLRMPLRAYAGVLEAVKGLGDVKGLSVNRQEGATVTDSAPAEMTVEVRTPATILEPDNGVWATTRRTLGEAFGAVMWSVRMIGVSLAFFAPWLVALAVVILGVKTVRRMRRKSE